MAYIITATFQANSYVACYTAFDEPFKNQIDIAHIGFRPDDSAHTIVAFPDQAKAMEWGRIWFRRNKRVMPALSQDFFSLVEVTVAAVQP